MNRKNKLLLVIKVAIALVWMLLPPDGELMPQGGEKAGPDKTGKK